MITAYPTVFSRRPDVVTANLGEELALLDMLNSSYLGFNATAAHVWRLLRDPLTLGQLCDAMAREFEVDPIRCRDEIAALLDTLLTKQLITERNEPRA